MCEGEVVSDLGVLTPRAGWGEKERMMGEQMRLAVLRLTDWTASGALDWGFPHSTLREVENGGGNTRKKGSEGEGALWLVTHSTHIKLINFTMLYSPSGLQSTLLHRH